MKQRESGLPFDDIRALVSQLPDANTDMAAHTGERAKNAPGVGNGMFLELCEWHSAWSGRSPVIASPLITLFAGTHKVDNSGEYWLLDRVTAIASGNAGINRVCEAENCSLKLLDLALQVPVEDISLEPAFDEKSCAGTIAFGMEAIAGGTDLLGLAAIENGANTSVLALLSALLEVPVADIAEIPGFDADQQQIQKANQAFERAGRTKSDPLELLRHLGGRETAAICGAILAARSQHIPVILSGPSAIAGAVLLATLEQGAVDHCRMACGFGDSDFANESLNDRLAGLGLRPVLETPCSPEPGFNVVIAATTARAASLALAEVQAGP